MVAPDRLPDLRFLCREGGRADCSWIVIEGTIRIEGEVLRFCCAGLALSSGPACYRAQRAKDGFPVLLRRGPHKNMQRPCKKGLWRRAQLRRRELRAVPWWRYGTENPGRGSRVHSAAVQLKDGRRLYLPAESLTRAAHKWGGFTIERPCFPGPGPIEIKRYYYTEDAVLLHLRPCTVRYTVGRTQHQYKQSFGSLLITPRDREYSDFYSADSAPGDRIVVRLDPSRLKHLTGADAQLQLGHHDGLFDAGVLTLIQMMELEICSGCPSGDIYAEALSIALVAYLQARYSMGAGRRTSRNGLTSPQFLQIRDFIFANLDRNFSLAELGALFAVSPFIISRLFKNTVGISPHKYVVLARIEEAKRLLANTGMALCDISAALGFANQSHFTRMFAQASGVTPGQYRRTARAAPRYTIIK